MEESVNTVNKVQTLLKFTYGIVPIVAGADKFTNLLTNWEAYLHPGMVSMLPVSAAIFMKIVGVIEIIAGILVFLSPQKGAYLVCVWLTFIALSLLAGGKFLDVAVRDLVMAIGAYSLAQLSGIKSSVSAQ